MTSFEASVLDYEFYGLLISGGQLFLIAWGLWLMQRAWARRDRQLDRQEKTLEDMGAGIRALLERSL